MNHDSVPQWTRPQWNIMKQFSGIKTSTIEPLCTVDSEWWWCEQLNISNLKEFLHALSTLNLEWKAFMLLVVNVSLFLVGILVWLDKSYDSFISSDK